MKRSMIAILILLLNFICIEFPNYAQDKSKDKIIESINKESENLKHRLDVLEKKVDDIIWYQRIGDAAFIDKVYLAGPPRWKIKDTTAQGAKNPLKFWSYVFIPKGIDFDKKYPLIVFPHGGVHSNFTTYYTHIVKELIAQQYIVVAAEYRGS
ncbi:MAG: S9 family peptidase, partial [Melioribacteraceae bacterium]|nr:S9 family peptidase [Melioribacteraceae bacterium]